jgi:hypothetical protein
MSTRIILDVTDPNLKEKLAVLPEKMLDYAAEVLIAQAHLIVGLAQIYCPVDTGSLRDSIRVERGGQGLHWREVRVRAGGYITNPRTNNIVNYAAYVEARTPFLGPAVEEVKPTIEAMLQQGVLQNV